MATRDEGDRQPSQVRPAKQMSGKPRRLRGRGAEKAGTKSKLAEAIAGRIPRGQAKRVASRVLNEVIGGSGPSRVWKTTATGTKRDVKAVVRKYGPDVGVDVFIRYVPQAEPLQRVEIERHGVP